MSIHECNSCNCSGLRIPVGRFRALSAIAVALLAGAGSVALGQMPVPTVSVVEARQQRVPVTLRLVGSVKPMTRSLIASEVAGIVNELPVEEGDRVEAGAVVCRLRNTIMRLLHDQAVAMSRQLQAELDELEAGTRAEEIEQAVALMEETRAMMEKWSEEYERIEGLRRQGVASLKEYNDTAAEYSAAKQRFAQAKATHDLAVAGPRKEEIARASFAVEAARAFEAKLNHDFEQTQIRAPFAGHIIRKATEVGQWINAGGCVVEMIDLESVLVRIDVPESAVSAAKIGDTVPVTIDALGRTFDGKIKHIIPQADEKARTFPIEVEVINKDHAIKAGMFARARVPAGASVLSVVVPLDAVLQRQGTDFVIVVVPVPNGQGQSASPVPVQLGARVGNLVAVDSSRLQAGSLVAVRGHDRIYGPQPVQVRPADSPKPTTQPGS